MESPVWWKSFLRNTAIIDLVFTHFRHVSPLPPPPAGLDRATADEARRARVAARERRDRWPHGAHGARGHSAGVPPRRCSRRRLPLCRARGARGGARLTRAWCARRPRRLGGRGRAVGIAHGHEGNEGRGTRESTLGSTGTRGRACGRQEARTKVQTVFAGCAYREPPGMFQTRRAHEGSRASGVA